MPPTRLRSWGLEREICDGAAEIEWLQWHCDTLAAAADGAGSPVGFPTREQSALISPVGPACVPQDHLESVLAHHLRALARASSDVVEFGTEVVEVDSRPDGVRAVLRDVAGGERRIVHARYLVAADGAHSTVRAKLGIPMHGPDELGIAVTALFHAPLWEIVGEHRYGIYGINHPEAEGVLLPAGPGDRWLYGVQWERARRQRAHFTEATMTRLIRLAAGVADLRPRIERIGDFRLAAQLAERFRSRAPSSSATPPIA